MYVFHLRISSKHSPMGLVPVFTARFAGAFSYCLISNISDY